MNRRTTQLTKEEVQEWMDLLHRLKQGELLNLYAATNSEREVWVDVTETGQREKIGGERNTKLDTS